MKTLLVRMYRVNQSYAHRLLEGIDEQHMCRQPVAKLNHPAWIIGHLALVGDRMRTFLGHDLTLPESWGPLFGRGSVPVHDASIYPSRSALVEAFDAAHDRLVEAYEAADEATLAAPNEKIRPEQMPTVHDLVAFGMCAHDAVHLGQLSAWRRMAGMEPVM